MKKLSAFDIGMIIAFVVVTLLGAGAWYYLSGQLANTLADVSSANSDFDKYSTRQTYLPSAANRKTLQSNIDLMQAQLDPLIQSSLQAPGDKLPTVVKQDTVAWKHDLDAEVSGLNAAAKLHGVSVPPNFYYGFSRYLNQNPGDEQTVVLSKQLLGVEQIATILINAPVRSIFTLRRTYEEESGEGSNATSKSDPDLMPGNALQAPGGIYTAYPFEIDFQSDTKALRTIFAALQKSPYVFVIRTFAVQNSAPDSPQLSDLDKLAGTSASGVTDSSPGAVAATYKGPQFLFGNESLHVKMRVDLIEWNGVPTEPAPVTNGGRGSRGAGRAAAGASQ